MANRHRNLLPRTGQTTSYPNGDSTDRDDGYFETGWPGTTRFVAYTTENIIYDRATGLTWIADPTIILPGGPIGAVYKALSAEGDWADSTAYVVGDLVDNTAGAGGDDLYYICISGHTGDGAANNRPDADATHWVVTPWAGSAADLVTAGPMNWADSIDNSAALTAGGYSDWRLPNMYELASIYNLGGNSNPNLYAGFEGAANGYYWSSTTRRTSSAAAYYVRFSDPFYGTVGTKTVNTYYPRPVRGGRING